jgi:hypothetical protein
LNRVFGPTEGLNQLFHPNGKLSQEYTIQNGERHGWMREWHANGQLAQECRFIHGRAEGKWSHWNTRGELLGVDDFKGGTGIGRDWHANGQVSGEVSYVDGQMTGRMRGWAPDGMLYFTRYFFDGRQISKKKYDGLCETNPSLPRFADDKLTNTLGNYVRRLRKEQREQAKSGPTPQQFQEIAKWEKDCEFATRRSDSAEAIAWLNGAKGAAHELGEMTQRLALNLVRQLYALGARKIWVVQIERDAAGAEYSKKLVIQLPKSRESVGKIYKLCADEARPFMDGSAPAISTSPKFMTVSLV